MRDRAMASAQPGRRAAPQEAGSGGRFCGIGVGSSMVGPSASLALAACSSGGRSSGRPTTWHQDLPAWPMIEAGTFTVWIALVDATVASGALQYIPGSHRWGRLAHTTLPREMIESPEGLRWLVPTLKHPPDVVPAVELAKAFHPASGSMVVPGGALGNGGGAPP